MRRARIALVGAGSTVFAKNLLGDILSFPELADATVALHDVDEERLGTSHRIAERLAGALGARPAIESTTDRARALDGADYVISMIQVGGYRPSTVTDFEVPKRFGLRQTIADTLGVSGIMRALRTVPVLLEISRDMKRLCPKALYLNYINPMAMIVWTLSRLTDIRTVGLATACRTRWERSRRASACRPGRSTSWWPASITWRSISSSNARARICRRCCTG